jgi:hypothetical protein
MPHVMCTLNQQRTAQRHPHGHERDTEERSQTQQRGRGSQDRPTPREPHTVFWFPHAVSLWAAQAWIYGSIPCKING